MELVKDPHHLADVVEVVLASDRVALDTEFFWERTFYPRLALVQLGLADGRIFLIDPLAIEDLSLLGLILVAPNVKKVVHDGLQDLVNVRRASGSAAPRSVFDTRLGAGFCGEESTLSLGALVERRVGVHLDKEIQRCNWLERPIPPERLTYAAGDVRHLIELHDALIEDADGRGNAEWMREEQAELTMEASTAEPDPLERYLRVKGRGKLDGTGLAVLREVTAERERQAQWRDRPRGQIMADAQLLAVAMARPRQLSALRKVKGVTERQLSQLGTALLEAVARGVESPLPEPDTRERSGAREKSSDQLAEALIESIDALGTGRGIDPALIASRSQLRSLAKHWPRVDPKEYAVLRGWRRELTATVVAETLG